MIAPWLVGLSLVLQDVPRAPATGASLAGLSLAAWRARIEPAAEELEWTEIPWRSTLWQGLNEAREQQRPLLLWAMNGHPLGCT